MGPQNLIESELLGTGGLHMFVCVRVYVCARTHAHTSVRDMGMGGIVETQDQDRRTFSDYLSFCKGVLLLGILMYLGFSLGQIKWRKEI